MKGILHQRWSRAGLLSSLLVTLAACSTYQPLDGGSTVPWARAVAPERGGTDVAAAVATPAGRRAGAIEVASVGEVPAADAAGRVHRVEAGEALARIARRYGVDMRALAAANGIGPPYTIHVGQRLRVPDDDRTLAATPAAAPAQRERSHEVRRGDTLSTIAERYGVSTRRLAEANGIAPPYRVYAGQELRIPAGGATRLAASSGEVPGLTGEGFLWPVKGKLLGRFGRGEGGERRDGIEIAARKGTPVRAAEDGVVVYAGDGIRGYGRMVLLRHDDGYLTTYAHNAALLVNVGDTVTRGQVIARVGDTGAAGEPHLYFELRKGREPIDPERVLVDEPTAVASTG